MTRAYEAPRIAQLLRYSRNGALFTMLVGALVLCGWALDIGVLKSIAPNLPSMKANTAIGFVMSGAALWLLIGERHSSTGANLGAGLGALVFVFGLVVVLEYLGWGVNIDEWVVKDDMHRIASGFPGRPSPITAVTFALLGAGLWALRFENAAAPRLPSQVLALLSLVTSSLGFLSYLYGASIIRSHPAYSSIALNTALTFMVFAVALLCVHPDRGFMRALTAASPGGLLARKLAPTVVIFTVALGWLRLSLQRVDLVDTESGLVLMVIGISGFVITATMVAARRIDEVDHERERTAETLSTTARRLSLALRAGEIGIWDWNTKTNDIVWDDQMYAMYGVPSGTPVVYQTWSAAVLPDDLAAAERTLQQTIAERGASDNHFRIRHPTLGVRHIAASEGVVLGEDGQVTHVIGVNRDVTAQKQAEARAAEAVKELEAFSYSVAHDLRAPLRAINGFSQILVSRGQGLDEDGRDSLRQILDASRRMGQLVDDLLSLSKVSRSEVRRGPVNLSQIVRDIADRLQRSAPQRAVEFTIQDGIVANTDGRLLTIALENLVGNAWKYTGKHPRAHIEFGVRPAGASPVYFVRDDGEGFDMAFVNKLFAPFQRLHDPNEFEGTGIGLATVQRIVQRLGGSVHAEGSVGAGATFSFTLG